MLNNNAFPIIRGILVLFLNFINGDASMKYLHTMVRVRDLETSMNFYCQQLGLQEIKRLEHKQGRFTLVFLAAPMDAEASRQNHAPLLELTYNWDDEVYNDGRNFGHLAFEVEDIYKKCDELENAGVIINRPPRDGYMAFIKSPDNISIELLQKGNKLPIDDKWSKEPNIGSW